MEVKLATRTQRLLVYLIDYALPCFIIANLFLPLFYKLIKFDVTVAEASLTQFVEELKFYIQDTAMDTSSMMNALYQYLQVSFIDILFAILFTTIFMIGYLIILPKFWSKQTVGRMATKTKVVKKNGEELRLKDIFVREGIGTILMYTILGNIIGYPIILASIILSYIDGRSLVDYIGKTCLITQKEEIGVYPNSPMRKNKKSDYIDAVVTEKPFEDNPCDDKDDDEYTII